MQRTALLLCKDYLFNLWTESIMKDINELMPKIHGMQWGAVTNLSPTVANLKELDKLLKHDSKWHLVINDEDQVHVDGITIRRKTMESMT